MLIEENMSYAESTAVHIRKTTAFIVVNKR
jgi:hypothetical protein